GIYTVSLAVETANGCRDTMVLNTPVKVVASPLISIGGESVICEDGSITHLGIFDRPDTSVVSWLWQIPNGTTSNLQNPPPQQYTPGSYTVTAIATNSSGCKDTATLPLTIHALPQITLPASITKLVGVPLTLPATYSTGTVGYLWTPSNTLDCATCPQPVTTTKFNTTYTVVSTDSNGCKNTDKIDVIVICKGATIFLPNTFSPNGDGSNDMFYMRGVGLDRVKSLRIFNRWGEVVFEQRDFPVNNSSYGWNGLYKGKKQPDVYIYQVEVFCENGEIVRYEGNVALIL
ncbi:MAG TPA: gliding motility-associated C-terminal domain-containing protein, partial [Chitinophagaceae bacterium]